MPDDPNFQVTVLPKTNTPKTLRLSNKNKKPVVSKEHLLPTSDFLLIMEAPGISTCR